MCITRDKSVTLRRKTQEGDVPTHVLQGGMLRAGTSFPLPSSAQPAGPHGPDLLPLGSQSA